MAYFCYTEKNRGIPAVPHMKEECAMTIRPQTLWRVPVFCAAASAVSFYLTVYLGRFFCVVETTGADGTPVLSGDPLRSALLNGALFVLVLLAGGLLVFRSMTRLRRHLRRNRFGAVPDPAAGAGSAPSPPVSGSADPELDRCPHLRPVPPHRKSSRLGSGGVSGAVSLCSLRKTVPIRII